ncbi:MAG: transglutaminase-like domain-containing protein, partial [Myxococcota bacterium]
MAPWLALPEQIDARIFNIAREVVGEAQTPNDKADALRLYFLREYEYTLSQPTAGAEDPLSDFVLNAKAGHCEHFATAFATMLRAVGVPARVVGGFQGGVWDRSANTVVFRLNNAHAWVEWYLPGRGWVTDDATPPFLGDTLGFFAEWMEWARRSWDEYVVDYALLDQMLVAQQVRQRVRNGSLLSWFNRAMLRRVGLVLGLLALGAVGVYVIRGRRRGVRQDPLAEAIERGLALAAARPLPGHLTFREMHQTLSGTKPALLTAIEAYEARERTCSGESESALYRFGERILSHSAP